MDSGYYAACSGLRAQTQALDVIASNLANINTGGYRAQQPTFHSVLASARDVPLGELNHALNDFSVLGGARVDLTAGNMEHTGGQFDLGIEGNGFFAVQTSSGTLYTRNGGFRVSPTGQLTTAQGDAVLGEQGAITLPSGPVSISSDGTISVNGAVAGKVRVVEFPLAASLSPVGGSYYAAQNGAGAQPASQALVRQGMLESSNLDGVHAVVNLIAVQRHAEMLQRAMASFYSDFDGIAAGELPRV